MNRFVPENFKVPEIFVTDRFRLRPLTVNDVIKDYDAVVTSVEHLQKTQPFGPDHNWPSTDISLEQDLIDLGWHQKEFQKRSSFAYTVMSLDKERCLGCLYINSSSNSGYDAEIIMWVRQSEVNTRLDENLYTSVRQWLVDKWPFKNPGYPGREIDWMTWNSSSK